MSEATMAGEILATITSSGAAVKSVVEAINAAKGKAKGNKEALSALLEAQDLALSVQASLFEAKEQALALQEENRGLRAQIRQHEERTLEREKYEIKPMGKDAAVVPKGEKGPLYCANCYGAGKMSVLGSTGMGSSGMPSHLCGICKSSFQLQ